MARSQIPFQVRNNAGDVRSGVNCTITLRSTGANALVWSAETGGTNTSGTTTTDANGWPTGWLDEGSYNIVVTGTPNFTRAFEIARGDGIGLAAPNSITSAKLAASTLGSDRLADGAITTPKYQDAGMTNAPLADDSVDTRVLADNAVTEPKVATGTLNARVLAPNAITAPKLAGETIGTNKLADGSVSSGKLIDASITNVRLGNDAVTNVKVQDASVTAINFGDKKIMLAHVTNAVIPVGFIVPYAASPPPSSKWLACQGQAISRTTYATLFAAISTTYGSGDGSTTFNLPDLRGRGLFPVNASGGGITSPGANEGQGQTNRGPRHHHTVGTLGVTGDGDHQHGYWKAIWNGVVQAKQSSADYAFGNTAWAGTGGGGGHGHSRSGNFGSGGNGINNAAPWLTVQFIIRVL